MELLICSPPHFFGPELIGRGLTLAFPQEDRLDADNVQEPGFTVGQSAHTTTPTHILLTADKHLCSEKRWWRYEGLTRCCIQTAYSSDPSSGSRHSDIPVKMAATLLSEPCDTASGSRAEVKVLLMGRTAGFSLAGG